MRVNGTLSESLSLKTGVKQGCVLSPLLFNIFMDWIVQRVMKKMEHTGIKIQYTKQRKWLNMKERDLTETILVNTLLYADDMVILDANFDNVKMFDSGGFWRPGPDMPEMRKRVPREAELV